MKKLFIMAVAAIAALSSCSSDIANGEENNGTKTLKAKMEVAGSRATIVYDYSSAKATPNWEVGDQIAVNGSTYQTKSAGTESELEAVSGSATGPYTAYFPASIYNSGTPTLPSVISETYTEGKFNMPMYAYSDNNYLHFKNLCGVLAIKVDNNDIEQVTSIRVTSSDNPISGAFSVDADYVAKVAETLTAGENTTLTVNYTSAVSPAATGTVFYIAIPKGQYGGLKIELSADGTTYTKSMTTKAGQNIYVYRNFIYEIDFADNSTPTPPTPPAASATWSNEWPSSLTKSSITSIAIEVSATKPSGATDLSTDGSVWYVVDGTTLKIQTSASTIEATNNSKFSGFSNVTTITGLDKLDTSDMTDMSSMFASCYKLVSLDLSLFVTTSVTNMRSMFISCSKLVSLDLSSFVTTSVTSMESMFSGCSALTSLNVSSFNTSSVTNMRYMFDACSSLITLNLENFNIGSVYGMSYMFGGCSSLSTLVLNNGFNVSGKQVSSMFFYCGNNCTVYNVNDPDAQQSLKNGTDWSDSKMHFE